MYSIIGIVQLVIAYLVYVDAKKNDMDEIFWTLLVLLVPLLGLILYFLRREKYI